MKTLAVSYLILLFLLLLFSIFSCKATEPPQYCCKVYVQDIDTKKISYVRLTADQSRYVRYGDTILVNLITHRMDRLSDTLSFVKIIYRRFIPSLSR